ncbi:helix-turn-helix transcriptional regulator [Streptomyces sp. NBC_00878]|uniref:helix-turn-helix domain-containing protein n=1 Tax=Streptomyces sp. NBC_00878 TaxID=2975854 RepID=UPI0022541350|nr:helix-turn-helix transcriptional regulator [Streptomyces sp. NBC_00878]MCX4905861.1 helix-turn-helix transcriptional regulator [Streptomyces sp. NBC_00878]
MARGKNIDGSMSVPTFYGKELRWKREAAGMSLEGFLEGIFYGKTYLSDIEHGQRRMPLDLARHADRVLETDGFFERNCEDVRKARRGPHAAYFEKALEAEKHAEAIELWSPIIFPGLLQTAAYARAMVRSAHPAASDEWVEEKVMARLARARLFEDDHSTPEYWAVLHESLLTDPILPPHEMAEQLDRVVELAERRRITPQIVPRTCGAFPLMAASIMVMTFPDAPPLIYTEASYSGDTIDDPALVKQYRKAYDRLRAVALSPETSLAMIKAAAEEYRNGKQPDRLE